MPWSPVPTPWGVFYAQAEEERLLALRFPGPGLEDLEPGGAVAQALARELGEYLRGERTSFDLPLDPQGTAFQRAVWAELQKVPYGTTVSYGELARRAGRPRAPRAVGQAVGANPLPIIIPCHRVLPGGGGLGGFGPGADWKRRLLELEGAYRANSSPR